MAPTIVTFEAVKDPGDTERQHDQKVEAAPGKSIQAARGYVGFERASLWRPRAKQMLWHVRWVERTCLARTLAAL